jgi:OOP family OmpA-OmpF porin
VADPARTEDGPRTPAPPLDREVPVRDRWSELRALLLDPERRRIKAVEQKLASSTLHVEEVSRLLPEAIVRRGAGDRALSHALGPVVGDAIKASVRKDPQPLVDAIFPIIGPAIRRAIASAFSELVQSVNTSLEHSLTPRGLAWRFEAMRTGRSFGEVVLSHSLVYRVEQLFVIHRESGLLIEHITLPGVQALPPDMVAGMLTAITDFARDSFHVSRQEGLDSFALGDLTVWVEQGPQATIASVIRGQAPADYRETMQLAVEALHRVHAEDIERSAATGQGFAVRSEVLEPCLVSQLQRSAQSFSPWRLMVIAGLVLLGIGWCAVPRALQARRFGQYLTTLRAEPGVVVGSSARSGGRYVVNGLRDPIARDPALLLGAHRLDTAQVTAHWEPYVALRPEFIVRRAASATRPPATVQFTLRGDTLVATGIAAATWVARAAQFAPTIAGVSAFDVTGLRDSAYVSLAARADSIGRWVFAFPTAVTWLTQEESLKADSLSLALRVLERDAAATGWKVAGQVRGAADSVGSPAANAALRVARARTIRQRLIAGGSDPASLTIGTDSSSARQARIMAFIVPRN